MRDALMQAFRLRGIVAEDAEFFSESSLAWPELDPNRLRIRGLHFGDPNGLTSEEKKLNGDKLRTWANDPGTAATLGFATGTRIEVPSFHPMFRVAQDGTLKIEMVIELIQTPTPDSGDQLPLRSGVTLIVAKPPVHAGARASAHVRYAIGKHLDARRAQRMRTAIAASDVAVRHADGRATINFSLVHGGA